MLTPCARAFAGARERYQVFGRDAGFAMAPQRDMGLIKGLAKDLG
jgi:hypothetical protein